jgi:hypothetical protein
VEAGATGATADAQPCPAQPDGQDERDNTGTRTTHAHHERFRLDAIDFIAGRAKGDTESQ